MLVALLNRYKRPLQVLVVLLGVLFLAFALYDAYYRGHWDFSTRFGKRYLNQLSKPAEIGMYALAGLYAVRKALKIDALKQAARNLFRLLQIIHVPLGFVVLGAASLHGLLFMLYRWENDFHHWTGVVGLVMLLGVTVLGLLTVRSAKRKDLHRVVALTAFAVVLIHIFTA